MAHEAHVETYQRPDGQFGWRIRAANGSIVATDAGQGFRDRTDALRGVDDLLRIIDNRGEVLRVEHE